MLVRFALDGTDYTYDADTYPLFEARLVKALTGLNAGAYIQGIAAMDEEALAAMVYLAKRRAGEEVEWDDLNALDLMVLIESIGESRIQDDTDAAVAHFEGQTAPPEQEKEKAAAGGEPPDAAAA